jgi:hypothetical protein
MTLLGLRKGETRARASKANLHRGEATEEPASKPIWQPRVIRENDPLNLGSHQNYIARRLSRDNEGAETKKGRSAALPYSHEWR